MNNRKTPKLAVIKGDNLEEKKILNALFTPSSNTDKKLDSLLSQRDKSKPNLTVI